MLPTILISVVLAAVVALVIIRMIRNRKKGKSACGCDCGGCSNSKNCH